MFKAFLKHKTTQIDPQKLLIDTDYALSDVDSFADDELLTRLGLSREQVFSSVMSDDEVESCQSDVIADLLASAWRLYGEDTDPMQQNKLYKNLKKHLPEIAMQVVVSRLCGFSVARVLYEEDTDGFIQIKKIISRHDELDQYEPKFNELIYHGKNGDSVVETKITHLFLTHKATSKNPAGEMAMARIYPAVMLRKDGWRYAYQFTKRYAQPYLVLKSDGDNDGASKMFRFLNGGGTQIGQSDEIVMLQNTANGDFFLRLEQIANARIQKAILGRVKTSELQNGSRAAQGVEMAQQQNRIESYLILLSNAVQQLVDAIIELNRTYGTPVQSKDGLIFEYYEEAKVDKNRAERDQIYAGLGLQFTPEYYEEQLGLDRRYFSIVPLSGSLKEESSLKNQLSLALSAQESAQLAADQKILSDKMHAILSAASLANTYEEFNTLLDKMDLSAGDQALIDKLVWQNSQAWTDGTFSTNGEEDA